MSLRQVSLYWTQNFCRVCCSLCPRNIARYCRYRSWSRGYRLSRSMTSRLQYEGVPLPLPSWVELPEGRDGHLRLPRPSRWSGPRLLGRPRPHERSARGHRARRHLPQPRPRRHVSCLRRSFCLDLDQAQVLGLFPLLLSRLLLQLFAEREAFRLDNEVWEWDNEYEDHFWRHGQSIRFRASRCVEDYDVNLKSKQRRQYSDAVM